jgi:hypothetical protein
MADCQHNTDLDQRLQMLADARLRLETHRGNALLTLLSARPELREVCRLADFVGERLLWCA